MDHETLLIKAFIIPKKRRRFLEFLSNLNKRDIILSKLHHFSDLDERYSFKIPANQQFAPQILSLLQEKGAPEECYVIGSFEELDGQVLKLKEVLDMVVGENCGVLISCIPGKLGYYEGENPGERYLLQRDI